MLVRDKSLGVYDLSAFLAKGDKVFLIPACLFLVSMCGRGHVRNKQTATESDGSALENYSHS